MATTLTVSKLPNITFYTGDYSIEAGEAIENRDYGHYIESLGYLSLSSDYNSYWSSDRGNTLFEENPVKYNNIGDIINDTISYMNKFKNNQVNITIDKNIIVFNFDYEKDLNSEYTNSYIIPSQYLYDVLINTNEMVFNKQKYYRNNNEIVDVTYAHKLFPYNKLGTTYISDVEGDPEAKVSYDFSGKYVQYDFISNSYDFSYIAYILDNNGNPIPGSQHTEYGIAYSYFIKNVDYLYPRFKTFFEGNSEKLIDSFSSHDTNELAYSISDLDTVVNLALNTYSLGRKNLIAYFNFTSKYNDWYNKSIQFETNSKLTTEDTITITPNTEEYFNITIGKNKIFGNDLLLDNIYTFKDLSEESISTLNEDGDIYDIVNPSNIKEIDLSKISNKITTVDLLHYYDKKLNVYDTKKSTWIDSTNIPPLTYLNIGYISENPDDESTVTDIIGITSFKNLETLDITNCKHLYKEFSIHKLSNLKNFLAKGTNRKTFIPNSGQLFTKVELPNSYLNTIILRNNTIEEFNYTPNDKLVNLTILNTTINNFNLQEFTNTWIESLRTNQIKTKENEKYILYSGLINNTILTGINFTDYTINQMSYLSYIGLNLEKSEGNINIKGSNASNYLTREEYMKLRDIWGDDLMHIGINNENNQNNIKFNYSIDISIFEKKCQISAIKNNDSDATNIVVEDPTKLSTLSIAYTLASESNSIIHEYYSGHSLFDYIKSETNTLVFNEKDIEGIGFKLELDNTIIPDLNKETLITYNNQSIISNGDIILYKGNQIILVVNKDKNTNYNYIKLGRFTNNFNTNMAGIDYSNIKQITLTFTFE